MIYAFEAYELDLQRYELRYAGTLVKLEPQVFNVLAYLIQHRERVVTKEELLEQLWPGRFVSEAILTNRLTLARRAIGDRGREQRLIHTVHGRGYRFIAPVQERVATGPAPTARPLLPPAHHPSIPQTIAPRRPLPTSRALQAVGRQAELAQLHRWLQRALRGTRQVGFVTGEAGLGKTTLVETFLQEVGGSAALWIGRGQCIEHYGAAEAYLPVLEALGGLCKESGGQELITLLARQAPTWVVQMPWLVTEVELETLQRRVTGATQERMLREMAEALAVVAAERPLILVLEDLHWSDHATLDLLAWLARQQGPARLLVLGTYRPADVKMHGHPLEAVVHELKLHRCGDELALTSLTESAVAEYLTTRFPDKALPQGLAHLVHQRTDGNPLFMVAVVDAWEAQGWLEEVEGQRRLRLELDELARGVPESLRQMLMRQLDQLSVEEQRVLEAASMAGVECSAAAVAAALQLDVVEAETRCERLAQRQQWLRRTGIDEWPDGTVAGRYAFIHALYQHVVSQQLAAARRVHLHQWIGASKQGAYGERAGEIAAELAVHFEQGRDYRRAVQYLQRAAETATRRYAHREVVDLLTRALALLRQLPETPERTHQELELQLALGPVLMATKGHAASEVGQTYARALVLCQQVGETPHRFPTLQGLCQFYHSRGEFSTARELAEQLYQTAQGAVARAPHLEAHDALGTTLFFQGEFVAARLHLERGIALTDPVGQRARAFRDIEPPGVKCLVMAAHTLWCLGYPAQALRRSQEALALAEEIAHPYSLTTAQHFAAFLHYRRREAPAVQAQAEALSALATEQGFLVRLGMGQCWRGWAFAMQGQDAVGVTQIHQGMAAVVATEVGSRPLCLVLLAEATGLNGQVEEGLRLLAEALAAFEASGRGDLLAEAYRLQGTLLLRQAAANATRAESCFQEALAVARRQQAKSWELRAAVSLGRLWQRQGKRAEALQLLAEVYGWFTEGLDTADLQEARALLEELS